MIIICGIPSEPPIAMVVNALEQLGFAYSVLHQRRFMETSIEVDIVGARVSGHVTINGRSIACADVTGIYTRLIDWRILPEVTADSSIMRRCGLWHRALADLIEIAPARVMNRTAATASNQSKPYQSQLILQAGFRVPETVITNDPEVVRAFRSSHTEVIYKSISGTRSIVRLLDDDALGRLTLIRSCPVQFQRFIAGTNVRVHVIGDDVFGTCVQTNRVDYRYARRDGGYAMLTPFSISDCLAEKCIALAKQLGLELAGIDLLLANDGEAYCLEVNPSPAFSFFENNTGQPIARTIAVALSGKS